MCLESNFIYFCKKIFNMRKHFAIGFMVFLFSCGGTDNKPDEVAKKDEPLSQSKNSVEFNDKFTNFLNSYYHLKDAMVLSNDTMANTSANMLQQSGNSLDLKQIK